MNENKKESTATLTAMFGLMNMHNTISVNRLLAHSIGLAETVVYQALLAKYEYWRSRDMLQSDETFFCTAADLQESTSLSEKQQNRVVKNLIASGLITKQLRGLPAKRYFKIMLDENLIAKYINEGRASSYKMSKLVSTKQTNKFLQNVELNKNKVNLESCKHEENNNMSAVDTATAESILIENGICNDKAAEIIEIYSAERVKKNVNYILHSKKKWKNIQGAIIDAVRKDYATNEIHNNSNVPAQLREAEKAIAMLAESENREKNE